MRRYGSHQEISSARKRLVELREKRRKSVSESIQRSRTTILINMAIEVLSGLIYAVGVFYAVRILNIRRSQMETVHYRIILGSILSISCVWFVILIAKARSNYIRLRKIVTPDDNSQEQGPE